MTKHASHQGQHWTLLGTAPASKEAWGLDPIEFPCGYLIPPVAFVSESGTFEYPDSKEDVWALGGLAVEIAKEARDVPEAKAGAFIAGYRPWLALYCATVRQELKEREHTITVWDQGVTLFYGLWRQNGQALGDLMDVKTYEKIAAKPAVLAVDGKTKEGAAPKAYAHSGPKIVDFMTRFMTLSAGDVYIMGPLVAQKVKPGIKKIGVEIGGVSFEKAVK